MNSAPLLRAASAAPLLAIATALLSAVVPACHSEPAAAPTSSHRLQSRPARSTLTTPLPSGEVRRVMNANATAFSGCYELCAAKNHAEGGSLTLEFEVNADGRVSRERVADSDFSDDVLRNCLRAVMHKTRFPSATAPTEVSWPLHFRRSVD